ncbi:hypothetical protein D1872_226700 [compost metagenome]
MAVPVGNDHLFIARQHKETAAEQIQPAAEYGALRLLPDEPSFRVRSDRGSLFFMARSSFPFGFE